MSTQLMKDRAEGPNAVGEEATRGGTSSQRSKADILVAAANCFEENGFAATSIDDVASALNATKGMVYHHFRSKTDLFFAVYRRAMEINFNTTRPFAEGSGSALERLTAMAMAHAMAMMAYQPFQRVLAQGVAMHQTGSTTAAQRETLVELINIRDGYEAMFRGVIEDLDAEKSLNIPSPSVACKSFLAVLNGTVFWYSPRKQDLMGEQEALARDLVKFALRGLGVDVVDGQLETWRQTNE